MVVYTLSKKRNWSLANLYQSAFGTKPTEVDGIGNTSTSFYYNQLLTILKGCFKITCPTDWDKDYILDALLLNGVFTVTDTTIGIVPLKCSPNGVNVFERASNVTISNPVLETLERKIGVDCVIVYLYDNKVFRNVSPLILKYAQRLASCDSAIDVNLINTKVATIFEVADGKQAETAKKIYDEISMGKPAVFIKKENALSDSSLEFHSNNVKNSFIADLVQIEKTNILNEFLTCIGLNNTNTDKRERLISSEVESNVDEVNANVNYWHENITQCCERVRMMFPETKFNIEMPFFKNNNSSTLNSERRGDE